MLWNLWGKRRVEKNLRNLGEGRSGFGDAEDKTKKKNKITINFFQVALDSTIVIGFIL